MRPPTQTSAPLPDWAQEAEARQRGRRGASMPPQQGGIPKAPATVSSMPTMGGGKVREQGKVSTAGPKVQRPQTGTVTPPEPALTQSLTKLWRGLRVSFQKSRKEREDLSGTTDWWQSSIPPITSGRFVIPSRTVEGASRQWRVGRFGPDGGLVMVLRQGHGLEDWWEKSPTLASRSHSTMVNYGRGFRLSPEELAQFKDDESKFLITRPHLEDPSTIIRYIPHVTQNDVHGLDIVHDPSKHWHVVWTGASPSSSASFLRGDTRKEIIGALGKLGAKSIDFEPLKRTIDRSGRTLSPGENNSYEQRKNLFQKFVDNYNTSTGGTTPADSFPVHPAYKLPSFIHSSFDASFSAAPKRSAS